MIDINNIKSVYSGKPGCCCGCLGKHTYASRTKIKAGIKRGYPINNNEVNDRVVKIIVNKMNKRIGKVIEEKTYFHLDIGSRRYIAYKN